MPWHRYLFIFFLFYFFALLQNSFFVHFILGWAAPNLVFIFFVFLTFLSGKKGISFSLEEVFYSLCASLFLGIFSPFFILPGLLVFLTGFLIKKSKTLLSDRGSEFALFYFLGVFSVSYFLYYFLYWLLEYFLGNKTIFGAQIFWNFIISLIFAIILYFLLKKFFLPRQEDKQLSLFRI